MYIFKAMYESMDTGEQRVEVIEFLEGGLRDEKECYLFAMNEAYSRKRENECFSTLEFIAG